MKKRTKRLIAIFAILTTLASMCAACAGCNKKTEKTDNTVPTVTTEPTVEPTKAVEEITKAPLEPTATPEPTKTPEVTKTPTPQPSPIPTIEPTATPVPTAPVEIPEGSKPSKTVKTGDNVWYDFYEDEKILVVRGTGSTDDIRRYEWKYFTSEDMALIQKVIIEEGVTRVGNSSLSCLYSAETIIIPSTLTSLGKYAFENCGSILKQEGRETEWIGFDIKKMKDVAHSAFLYCPSMEVREDMKNYTFEPTPTPTPKPNPDKPRLIGKAQIGDNATYEFWDNGISYIKGTGATWDVPYHFFTTNYEFSSIDTRNIHTLVIEEGITHLGEYSILVEKNVYLPKSLKTHTYATLQAREGYNYHGYNADGVKDVFTVPEGMKADAFKAKILEIFGIKFVGE